MLNQTIWHLTRMNGKKRIFDLRGRMYGNLFEQRLLAGKTRREVTEILGNPDEEDKGFVKYAVDLGSIFERWLNRNFIVVTFDERTQIVKEYLIADS
jgi:hypothetical protein